MSTIIEKRRFVFERATKNTYRFQEVLMEDGNEVERGDIGTLYIMKSAFNGKKKVGEGSAILVTVEQE